MPRISYTNIIYNLYFYQSFPSPVEVVLNYFFLPRQTLYCPPCIKTDVLISQVTDSESLEGNSQKVSFLLEFGNKLVTGQRSMEPFVTIRCLKSLCS